MSQIYASARLCISARSTAISSTLLTLIALQTRSYSSYNSSYTGRRELHGRGQTGALLAFQGRIELLIIPIESICRRSLPPVARSGNGIGSSHHVYGDISYTRIILRPSIDPISLRLILPAKRPHNEIPILEIDHQTSRLRRPRLVFGPFDPASTPMTDLSHRCCRRRSSPPDNETGVRPSECPDTSPRGIRERTEIGTIGCRGRRCPRRRGVDRQTEEERIGCGWRCYCWAIQKSGRCRSAIARSFKSDRARLASSKGRSRRPRPPTPSWASPILGYRTAGTRPADSHIPRLPSTMSTTETAMIAGPSQPRSPSKVRGEADIQEDEARQRRRNRKEMLCQLRDLFVW